MSTLYFKGLVWIGLGYSLVFAQDIIFRDNNQQASSPNESVHIPEALLIRMQTVIDVKDFIREFLVNQIIIPPENDSDLTINGRTGLPDSLPPIAKNAICTPEKHVVELEKPTDPAMMLFPSCVRVQRCGGCCSHGRQHCTPTVTSTKSVRVVQARYNPAFPDKFVEGSFRTFDLEEHEACECACKETPNNCISDVQEYKENECKCVCKNQEQFQMCKESKKAWNDTSCECKCQERPCSTGRQYNMKKCRCESLRSLLGGNMSRNSTQ